MRKFRTASAARNPAPRDDCESFFFFFIATKGEYGAICGHSEK